MKNKHSLKSLYKTLLFLLLGLLFSCVCCNKKYKHGISYLSLVAGDEVKKTGKLIQGLPLGLNKIFYNFSTIDTVIIAVHGYGSLGHEWVYPLKYMAESKKQVFYYRWNWNRCPKSATKSLLSSLKKLFKKYPTIKHIIVFGHSYGGIIAANLIDDPLGSVEIHSVAAPLSGYPKFNKKCPDWPDYEKMNLINSFTQWRTQHKQDGAFMSLVVDPQGVSVRGGSVVQLPDSINGRRLGHNRSISYVVNKYFEKQSKF